MPPNDNNVEENFQSKDKDSVNIALMNDKCDNLDVITTQPEKKDIDIPSENFHTLPSKNTMETDCATCMIMFCNAMQECWIACWACIACCDNECCAECLQGTIEGCGECLQGCVECCAVCSGCM